VLVTVSDARIPANGTGGIVGGYAAIVKSATDYSAFGAPMPGRNANSADYSRGFNGQLKDDEITGSTGTMYSAEFWEYDTRLGRRWNTDPVTIPSLSSYSVMMDNPIWHNDPDGDIVDPGQKGTKEYRQNMWHHFWNYHFSRNYRDLYNRRQASDVTYYMHKREDDQTATLQKGGTVVDNEDGSRNLYYSSGFAINMQPGGQVTLEFRDVSVTMTKTIHRDYPYSTNTTSHHKEVVLTNRAPGTDVVLNADGVPDKFTITDPSGNVLNGPVLLGDPNQYQNTTERSHTYNPSGGQVIVLVDSQRTNAKKDPNSNPNSGNTDWTITYQKELLHFRFPVIKIVYPNN
jgi:RHS repeat-associated protein